MRGENTTFERLSCFVDGELGPESTSLVDRMLRDEELKSAWGRYQVIGDALRRESCRFDPTLLENIRTRLAEEPTVLAPGVLRKPHAGGALRRLAAGAAIAAGVAAVAVVGVNRLGTDHTAEIADAAGKNVASTQQVAKTQPAHEKGGGIDEPEVSRKLHRYLATHSNIASSGSLNGVMPLATFITSDE